MFSGLTNQMSSWMGKKGEEEAKPEDSTLPEDTTIPADDLQDDAKKEQSAGAQAGGSRLMGLKSQMSNVSSWLSRKEDAPPPPTLEEIPPSPVKEEKDDDNSSATGGADSEHGGDSEIETEDAAAGQNGSKISPSLSKVAQLKDSLKAALTSEEATTKALAGAKTLGNFFYSAVNKAGAKVSEASAKIKKTVEENRLREIARDRERMEQERELEKLRERVERDGESLLGEFNKDQDAFIKEKKERDGGTPVAPWVGCPDQERLREECLALSTDRRNFVRAPPEGVEFSFDMEREFSVCQAILQDDPNLEKMRFELVPKVISEENFWRNYLYRINLICQAAEVSNMAESAGGGQTETTTVGDGFVSEEFPASSEDMKEVQDGLRKLGINTEQESQEWEKELEAELQDYEMVGDKSIGSGDLLDSDIDDLK